MFILYMTVNIVNLKRYYGIHRQKDGFGPKEFDGYLGSGNLLLKAIKKYGKSNFNRVTLASFTTLEEALAKEQEVVCQGLILANSTYNMTLGGGMPPSTKGRIQTEEHKRKRGVYDQKGKTRNYSPEMLDRLRTLGKNSKGRIKPKCSCIFCRRTFGCNVIGPRGVHSIHCK